MCDVISCSNTVVTTRGQEGFTPVGIALLQQERDKAQAAEAQRDVDAQNPTVTDDDLDRTFSVLNPKRKQMGGKIFVSFFTRLVGAQHFHGSVQNRTSHSRC